ncbi:MAG TPA: hypothetical protein VFV94_14960 [Polyangiaceae bacterium]|nr:hypothetical protein [Polyangiaceae bacterium]
MLGLAHRDPRGRPSRVLLGLAVVLAAWVVVLAQLASTLHFALISHEICAQHGELLHRASGLVAHPSHHEPGAAALPAGIDAEHDHCPLLGRRHDQATALASPRLELAPPLATLDAARREGLTLTPSRARLLLSAPKQSPPV